MVAVGIPSLWCALSVEVDDRDWQQAAFCYDSWLKRTQGRPLSLTLEFNANDHSTKLRCLLQPYSSQITSLSVGFWDPNTPAAPGLVMFPDFLALEELTIEVDSLMDDPPLPAIGCTISQLFNLRSLYLDGLWLDHSDLSSFKPVWPRLTNVMIEVYGPYTTLRLLQLAPNLSSLSIHIMFNVIQALEPFTHMKHQSLIIACGCEGPGPQLTDLLDALSLPALRVLRIYDALEWPHEELKAFLVRSGCPLENLIDSGGGRRTTSEQRAEYVALLPSLQFMPW
ncbi:hypothetical protein EDB19DRAFT_2039584 [Suillus lakei]|nr:hypothetical protein EDB19DRAFT_2039584 [Suillus lakei]